MEDAVSKYWKNGTLMIHTHVLGDAAIDLVLKAMEKAEAAQGPTQKRHVFVHAGMVRPDQVARMAKLRQVGWTARGWCMHGAVVHRGGKCGLDIHPCPSCAKSCARPVHAVQATMAPC